jgi:hypothetical protein
MNMIGMVALRAALEFFERIGHQQVETRFSETLHTSHVAWMTSGLSRMGEWPATRREAAS